MEPDTSQFVKPTVRLNEAQRPERASKEKQNMNSIIYIVGLIVVVLFILSFLGLR